MIIPAGSVVTARIVRPDLSQALTEGGEPLRSRVQVISDGPPDEPGSVWAVTYGGGPRLFVLLKRDGAKVEPQKWVARLQS